MSARIVIPPVLETARLILRQWTLADFEPLVAFMAVEELNLYRGGTQSRDETWYYLTSRAGEWQLRGYGCFAIEDKASGACAGYCGLRHPDQLDEPELMWSLFAKFHGRGYATEAARAVQVWAHETLKLSPLMSYIHPDNHASIKVAERLGASNEALVDVPEGRFYRYRHVVPSSALSSSSAMGMN